MCAVQVEVEASNCNYKGDCSLWRRKTKRALNEVQRYRCGRIPDVESSLNE